jgi:hypothetical protein
MPQETNLNVSPYFDDFDSNKNYYKVLFKPGYPIQARELTNLQSILQNQVEKFGNHIFKDGSIVIPGQLNYNNSLYSIQIENFYSGIPISSFLNSLKGKVIRGSNSSIRAKILGSLNFSDSPSGNITFFVNYLNSNIETGEKVLSNAESLIIEETIFSDNSNSFISAETEFAVTISSNATSIGSAVILSSGVYFIRGYFLNVDDQVLILDPHSNNPSYRVGFNVIEDVVNSDEDDTLTDNAQGFNNYAAPGADRFRITVELVKKDINDTNNENFIELLKIDNGKLIKNVPYPQYNIIRDELARRTYDESGDYYVNPFKISAQETLNNLKGNNGVFLENQTTYNNNKPSLDLGSYKVSPGKAYIKGYEVETISPTYLDFEKTRTSKDVSNEVLNYVTGPTYSLNRVYGSPSIGINTSYTVSLRSSRVGSSQTSLVDKEIGLARVYDFALESGGYNVSNPNTNIWDISLFDIQTYTDVTFNTPTTLSVPTYIKGKSSGATGYLRYSTSNSGIATFYNVQGKFVSGEKYIFNGTEDLSRVSVAVTSYGTGDVKSLYGIVGSAYTFTADVVQTQSFPVGFVSITASSGGISTVSSSAVRFTGIAAVGNLVSYSAPGLNDPSYARIVSINEKNIGIQSVATVTDICNGSLPTTPLNVGDFSILSSPLLTSSDNTLYTTLPKSNISSVDLTNSRISIRRQYDVTITNGETSPISCGSDEKFLSFDEERYILIRESGVTESLSADKIKISRTSTPEVLTIVGLTTGVTVRAKLIVTLEKSKVKSKIKNKNRIKTITIDKSKVSQSGIGTTTINDGLTYGLYPYGTRVQDDEICLLTSDVSRIYGIFESDNLSNPDLPSIILESIQSNNNSTNDFVIGEQFIGVDSNAIGIYVENLTTASISFIYLNDNRFLLGETIGFKESGTKATVSSIFVGDKNITENYIFENGQGNTIYDYSKIIRKVGINSPTRKVEIIFEYSSFSASDNGDIITKNSYDAFDYSEIPFTNGIKNSDILDIRPSVSDFTVSIGSRSPFEFLGRSFISTNNTVPNILASDEDINIDYSFYLPRIDRIYVSKNGVFQVSKGEPSETPELPKSVDDSIEIAVAYLPAYIYNINDIKFNVLQYKRYTMKDICKLETRIENLEYYTTLSLLETKTSNLIIKDAQGLDRFKSGFFVDNFETAEKQKRITTVKNSIDIQNSELRPSHYTTSIDLGFGDFEADSLSDLNYNPIIQGSNITKSERIVTLLYSENELIKQLFATRVENVTPYLVTYYSGTIELNPTSDTWVDTVRMNANTIVAENYIETQTQLSRQDFDSQSGFGQIIWGSWNTMWTGNEVAVTPGNTITRGNNILQRTNITTTKTSLSTRTGTSTRLERQPLGNTSLGDKVVNTSVVAFMRSRNIEFIGKRFKPFSELYAFFDGVDVNQYCFPKLIEIQMVSGAFSIGETIIGTINNSNVNSPHISFRAAQLNHRDGVYNSPSDVYTNSPYDTNIQLSGSYSSTSTILNIDLFSLSSKSSGDFYGRIVSGMTLRGQTSKAVANVSKVRIVTDNTGSVKGSFFIADPNVNIHPKFETGTKIFRLTSSSTNTLVGGLTDTSAEEKYFAQGKTETVQENILSVRTVRKETAIILESRPESGTPNTVVVENVVGTVPPPAPPIVPPAPPQPPVVPRPPTIPTLPPTTPNNDSGTTTIVSPSTLTSRRSCVFTSLATVTSSQINNNSRIVLRPDVFTILRVVVDRRGNIVEFPVLNLDISVFAFTSLKIYINNAQSKKLIFEKTYNENSFKSLPNSTNTTTNTTNITNNIIKEKITYQINDLSLLRTFSTITYQLGTPISSFNGEQVLCSNPSLTGRLAQIQLSDQPAPVPSPPRVDPLAQSFFVEQPTGVFVTGLDLYFQSKDAQLPVTIQLRSMSLGTPTEIIYPFSEVTLVPNQIEISNDASVPTSIKFPSPIFLAGNQEHAIVLLSNSSEYKVWSSRLGESDISTISLPESQQVIVTKQSSLGSMFKSQNGSTWTPSQYDDLKFRLYNAQFVNNGSINFYNPALSSGNSQIAKLIQNPLEISSRKIRVGLGTIIADSGLTLGNTIIQQKSNASGKYVGVAGSTSSTLLITNPGIGYTPLSSEYNYTEINLRNITGSGRNAKASVYIKNGVAIAATISDGGVGYQVGDVLTIDGVGANLTGRNLQLTVQSIIGNNELILDNVQGEFVAGVGYTVRYINNSGISTDLNGTGSNVLLLDPPQVISDGLHVKVNHKNHGMHSDLNQVIISNVLPDTASTTTFSNTNGTDNIVIANTGIGSFGIFENVSVTPTNPGYARIGNEIISYTGVVEGSPGSLTGIVRGIDVTRSFEASSGTEICKYELNGISLRRINRTHDFVDVNDSVISNPIGLDYYYIRINTSTNGVDRSVGTSYPNLYFKETKNTGANDVLATQNIQFESLTPTIQTMTVAGTNISASVRTVTGTSIDGSEIPFIDNGFEPINLNSTNYFSSPRIVCSKINESNKLTTLPNNKSFTLSMDLTTTNPLLSPVIDLDRVAMIFTTNRINSVIKNYITDGRISTLKDDPSSFVYATEVISLEAPASSIKIVVESHVNSYSDVRAFYGIVGDPSDEVVYYPFPGYSNRLISGEVIDISKSDGTPDIFVSKTDKVAFESSNIEFKDYEFSIDNLSSFRYFSIKLVGTSTNQAYPPRFRDLRVIALA